MWFINIGKDFWGKKNIEFRQGKVKIQFCFGHVKFEMCIGHFSEAGELALHCHIGGTEGEEGWSHLVECLGKRRGL
jgi:hypothetical protein